MAEPFLAEIRIFSFSFAPTGWAACDGQLLPISQNQGLYSLLGTTYGGDGERTFGLPDLRDRVPMHRGNGHVIGEKQGEAAHALSLAEMPAHSHTMLAANTNPFATDPGGSLLANNPNWSAPPPQTTLQEASVTSAGSGQAHPNVQPFLALTFCIALQGSAPVRQ